MATEELHAIVLGPTGLVGRYVVDRLLQHEDFDKVIIIHRRQIDLVHGKLEQHEVVFDELESARELFKADHVFCCLGTTIKKAGSEEEFEKVDREYVLQAARIASDNEVTRFMVISSIGANPRSRSFYPRTKGLMEEDMKKIPFKSLGIFRPSFLDGPRQEKRRMEQTALTLMKTFSFLFVGKWKKYKHIHAETVAKAMIRFAVSPNEGIYVFESDEIREIADK